MKREQNNGLYTAHLLVIDIVRYHRNKVTRLINNTKNINALIKTDAIRLVV
jgi:hypothetical protein